MPWRSGPPPACLLQRCPGIAEEMRFVMCSRYLTHGGERCVVDRQCMGKGLPAAPGPLCFVTGLTVLCSVWWVLTAPWRRLAGKGFIQSKYSSHCLMPLFILMTPLVFSVFLNIDGFRCFCIALVHAQPSFSNVLSLQIAPSVPVGHKCSSPRSPDGCSGFSTPYCALNENSKGLRDFSAYVARGLSCPGHASALQIPG